MVRYHDEEWGVAVHDDRLLFEMLVLEGAQAGLSWRTILHKREGYRRAFDGFDAKKIARYDAARVERLMKDDGIVRNRLKIESTVSSARSLLEIQRAGGSLDALVWSFVGGVPKVTRPASFDEVPARTADSDALSKALKKLGCRFDRLDDRLRLHAGVRPRRRPPALVLPGEETRHGISLTGVADAAFSATLFGFLDR